MVPGTEGIIYVADWDNDRLQVFDTDGRYLTQITGDATLSKWGETKLDANPEMRLQREIAQGLEREKFLRGPIGVTVDDEDRVFIVMDTKNLKPLELPIPGYVLPLLKERVESDDGSNFIFPGTGLSGWEGK